MNQTIRILLIAVMTLGWVGGVARAVTPAAIDQSLAQAKTWLYSQQQNGNWENVQVPEVVKDDLNSRDPNAGQFTGRTALAVLALLNSGERSSDPRIKQAVEFILKNPTNGVYALGMRCQLWLALPESPQTLQAMRNDAKILLASAKQTGTAKGMYDYTLGPSKMYSHSRAQYAILGLWAASQMGAEIPVAYWKTAGDAWTRNQDKSGGWTYMFPSETPFPPTQGMTTVGVASMIIIQEQLQSGINCTGSPPNPAIEKGIDWLASHMDKYATVNTYRRYFPFATLYGYERVGAAAGLRYLGDVDWYEKGSEFALSKQSPEGGWSWTASEEFDSVVNTSFAMLFLAKGRAPIVMSKLQYAAAKPGSWNQRGRDAANLVRQMGRTVERELAFQVLDLKASQEDLLEAPLLYIAGSAAVNFNDAEKAKIKAYVEGGGIVLANADCAAPAFATSIKQLGHELFPDAEFGELPQDNLIYTAYYPRSKWKIKPSVLALSNGARQLMILVPQADPAKAWQLQDTKARVEMFELPTDLLLYAVDRQNLRYRGERFYLPDDPAAKVTSTVTVARLKYPGFWDPEPGGWRRLNVFLKKREALGVETKTAEFGKNQIGLAKIAHLTGTYDYQYTDAQRDELKQFVDAGGTLVIDAAGGNSGFATSAEKMLGQIYPNDKLQLLPPDHPLFTAGGGVADKISYRNFAIHNGIGRAIMPRLQGITLNGRLAIIYSREDLSVGLVGQSVDGIIGYSPETATNLMARILKFAGGVSHAKQGK